MSALTGPRRNFSNKGPIFLEFGFPAKASQTFYANALAMKGTDGYLIPAATTAGGRVSGVVEAGNKDSISTAGLADGDKTIVCRAGIFPFAFGASTDALTKADEGNDVYVLDDQTVGRLPGSGRPVAGQLFLLDGTTAWVAIGFKYPSRDTSAGAGTAYQGDGSVEAIAAPGPLSVNTHISTVSVDGTDPYSLADGLFKGQEKIVVCIAGANTPVGTVTPATPSGFATVTDMGAVGDLARFVWTGSAWVLTGANGVTVT